MRILKFECEVERAPRGKQKKFNPRNLSSEFIIILLFITQLFLPGFLANFSPFLAQSISRLFYVRDSWTGSGRASEIHGLGLDVRPESMDRVRTCVQDPWTGSRKRVQETGPGNGSRKRVRETGPGNGSRQRVLDPLTKSSSFQISVILAP